MNEEWIWKYEGNEWLEMYEMNEKQTEWKWMNEKRMINGMFEVEFVFNLQSLVQGVSCDVTTSKEKK